MQSVARCSCENNYIITLKTEYKRLRWKEKQFNHRAQNNILIRQHAAADESADEVTREFWMFFVAFAQLIAMTQRPPGVRVLITRSVCTLIESNGKLPLEASQQSFTASSVSVAIILFVVLWQSRDDSRAQYCQVVVIRCRVAQPKSRCRFTTVIWNRKALFSSDFHLSA